MCKISFLCAVLRHFLLFYLLHYIITKTHHFAIIHNYIRTWQCKNASTGIFLPFQFSVPSVFSFQITSIFVKRFNFTLFCICFISKQKFQEIVVLLWFFKDFWQMLIGSRFLFTICACKVDNFTRSKYTDDFPTQIQAL